MCYMCLRCKSLSLCAHLQVNISDPFDDPMRGPYQWIHILVFTLYPASLQCLETILTNTFYSNKVLFLPAAWAYSSIFTLSSFCECGVDLHLPPCQNWVCAAVRCPAASWPGGTSWWCWGDVRDRDAWGSSACVRLPSECERPGSTEASPRHLTRPWPPSGGPYLQPWTACRQTVYQFLNGSLHLNHPA